MRIAVVHSFYSSRQPSGENAVVEDQVLALSEAGHEVRLVARRTDDAEASRFYTGRSALAVATGRGPSPADELADFAPDVVHLHNTFPNFGTAWLGHWGERTVTTLHNYRLVCAAGTLFRDGAGCHDCLHTPALPALRHACYRGSRPATLPLAVAARPGGALRRIGTDSAEVVVLNDAAEKVMVEALRRPVHVIPNFTAEPSSPQPPTAPRGWIFVGRLAPEKGILELVDSWPPGELLDIVGAGPLESEVRKAIARRGQPGVRLVGLLERAQLVARLDRYEGLLLPSLWPEGLPTVVLEALSCGLPIVVSDRVSTSRSLEESGVATVMVTPLSAVTVPAALEELRRRPEMRAAAIEHHRSHYSRRAWLDAMLPLYEGVANT